MKTVLITALALLVLAGATLGFAWSRYQQFLQTPLAIPATGELFEVQPGYGGADIVRQLSERGFTQAGWEWKLLMRLEASRSKNCSQYAGSCNRLSNQRRCIV